MIWILRLYHRWRGRREYRRQVGDATRLDALRLLLRRDAGSDLPEAGILLGMAVLIAVLAVVLWTGLGLAWQNGVGKMNACWVPNAPGVQHTTCP